MVSPAERRYDATPDQLLRACQQLGVQCAPPKRRLVRSLLHRLMWRLAPWDECPQGVQSRHKRTARFRPELDLHGYPHRSPVSYRAWSRPCDRAAHLRTARCTCSFAPRHHCAVAPSVGLSRLWAVRPAGRRATSVCPAIARASAASPRDHCPVTLAGLGRLRAGRPASRAGAVSVRCAARCSPAASPHLRLRFSRSRFSRFSQSPIRQPPNSALSGWCGTFSGSAFDQPLTEARSGSGGAISSYSR